MTKSYVKSELQIFSKSHSIYEMGWSFLYSYASKLLALVNGANDLNCDKANVALLNQKLLEFQGGITATLLKTELRDISHEAEFRIAIVNINNLKKKFISVCLDEK